MLAGGQARDGLLDQKRCDPLGAQRGIDGGEDDGKLSRVSTRDPGFLTVEHIVVPIALRAGLERDGVAAVPGLGERVGTDDLARRDARQVLLLLLLGAELDDRRRDERILDRGRHTCRRTAAIDLLERYRERLVAEAGAAELLRDQETEEAEVGQRLPVLGREPLFAIETCRRWLQHIIGEVSRGLLDQL